MNKADVDMFMERGDGPDSWLATAHAGELDRAKDAAPRYGLG